MFCDQCGAKLAESAKFCPGCGTQVVPSTPSPKSEMVDNSITHTERMDKAFALLDAGRCEDARLGFEEAYGRDDPLAPLALLGLAELYEKLGDDNARLRVSKMAMGHDERLLKLGMMIHHEIPILWPGKDQIESDPIKAILTQASLLITAASFLPEGVLSENLEAESAKFISSRATNILYMEDARIAEAQIHSSVLLAFDTELELQMLGMHNLHFFLRSNPPARIGAVFAMNSMTTNWKSFNSVLEQLQQGETEVVALSDSLLSEGDLISLDGEFDALMGGEKYNFHRAFVLFRSIVDYLVSNKANQDSPLIKQLQAKYRGLK